MGCSALVDLTVALVFAYMFFFFTRPVYRMFGFASGGVTLIGHSTRILRLFMFCGILVPFKTATTCACRNIKSKFGSLTLAVLERIVLDVNFTCLVKVALKVKVFKMCLKTVVKVGVNSLVKFVYV